MGVIGKRGEVSIPLILAIIVGVIVLVIVILPLTSQGRSWKDVIANLGGGNANVDTVKTGCEIACEGQSGHAYCEQVRKVDYGDKTWEKGSCKRLEESDKITISYCDIDCSGYTVPELKSSTD